MSKPNETAVHRSWDWHYPVVARTDGIYIWDTEGKRYIDGSGGSSVVTSIGHGVTAVPQAMAEQARDFSFYPAHTFSNAKLLELCDLLARIAPVGMRGQCKTWLTCTGTDAVDDAVRLARQHFVEKGQPGKHQVICRWQGFHGNNIAVAGFSGITSRRSIFAPMFVNAPHIPPAFCYRCWFEQTYPSCGLLCARALEKEIKQQGPDNVAAFIAEPVVGAALAAAPAPDGYFQIIRDICTRYNVLFIADEVMTGFGRTGWPWGIDYWGVTPDIIAAAKGMTSGYTPMAAVIAHDNIWQPLIAKNSAFKGGHTLNANAVSCAGAVAAISYLFEQRLPDKSREVGAYFLQRLGGLLQHTSVGDVRGRGMMVGIEMVADKATRRHFPPSSGVANRLFKLAFDRGLIVYPCTGTVDGQEGDMVLLAPPLITTREQVDEIVHILDDTITALEQQPGVLV